MKYTSTTGDKPSPTAHIAVNRNRIKQYGNKVYLKDGTHFEIELYNPKKSKVLAKIYIDDKLISSTGLVIKPGQRVYLERWIDEPKKFLFETYEVENTTESKEATSENGRVKIEFYDEFIKLTGGFTTTWTYDSYPSFGGSTINTVYFSNSNLNSDFSVNDVIGANSSIVSSSLPIAGSFETGRTEKGELSGQSFGTDDSEYNFWASDSVFIRLLPESRKPVEVQEIRNYCTDCGSRIKKSSWKFCPSCGTKI
jgi:hypothetical protein